MPSNLAEFTGVIHTHFGGQQEKVWLGSSSAEIFQKSFLLPQRAQARRVFRLRSERTLRLYVGEWGLCLCRMIAIMIIAWGFSQEFSKAEMAKEPLAAMLSGKSQINHPIYITFLLNF